MKSWVVRVATAVLVVGGAAIFATGAPFAPVPEVEEVPVPAGASKAQTDVAAILSNAEANEALADSAPQQQVVNGWVAKDLLAAIALEQQSATERQLAANERWSAFAEAQLANAEQARTGDLVTSTLLIILVVLVGLAVITGTGKSPRHARRAAVPGPPPPPEGGVLPEAQAQPPAW